MKRFRLRNGRFASVAKARAERNKWFHRALISAMASLRRGGFAGEVTHTSINASVLDLREAIDAEEIIRASRLVESTKIWPDIIRASRLVESTKIWPDLLYNVSFQDTTGRWFAATHAWESIELCMVEIRKRLADQMQRYQRADKLDDDDYLIVAIEVSVYPWRK